MYQSREALGKVWLSTSYQNVIWLILKFLSVFIHMEWLLIVGTISGMMQAWKYWICFKILFLIRLTFRFILQQSSARLFLHYIFWHNSVVSKLWGLDKPVLYYSYQYFELTLSRVKQASGAINQVLGIIAVLVIIV